MTEPTQNLFVEKGRRRRRQTIIGDKTDRVGPNIDDGDRFERFAQAGRYREVSVRLGWTSWQGCEGGSL